MMKKSKVTIYSQLEHARLGHKVIGCNILSEPYGYLSISKVTAFLSYHIVVNRQISQTTQFLAE